MNKHQSESGQDIEKLLTEVIPQADTHFQEKLEGHLLVAYLQKKERDKVKANGHLVTYTDFAPQRGVGNLNRRWSITLAATLLMALLFGFILISIGDNRQAGYSGAPRIITVTATPSPTPIATVSVVVASQYLRANQIIMFSSVRIQDYPADQVPADSFSDANQVVGAQLLNNVVGGRPILKSMVSSNRILTDFNTPSRMRESATVAYPKGSLVANVRVSPDVNSEILGQMESGTGYIVVGYNEAWYQIQYTSTEQGWVLQSFVSIQGNVSSMGTMAGSILRPVVITAQAIQRGTVITEEMLTVVYWPNEIAATETYDSVEALVGQIASADLRPYSPILATNLESHSEVTRELKEDTLLVEISVPLRENVYFYGFQVGDRINITAIYKFVPMDDRSECRVPCFQSLATPTIYPPSIETSETSPEITNPQMFIEEAITYAEILSLDFADDSHTDMVMVLAVTPREANIWNSLVARGIPVFYHIISPAPATQETQ
ncbi:MAG: flagella basal body P-ring formation protein FlgA [Chloroflexi bacterium]|nr:flagella basal body P-ring formation protein FlgA [Chloroflexota bacterium]